MVNPTAAAQACSDPESSRSRLDWPEILRAILLPASVAFGNEFRDPQAIAASPLQQFDLGSRQRFFGTKQYDHIAYLKQCAGGRRGASHVPVAQRSDFHTCARQVNVAQSATDRKSSLGQHEGSQLG
jgi:hypothetical protein